MTRLWAAYVLGALGVGLAVVPREKIERRRALPRVSASGVLVAKKARPPKVTRAGAIKARGPKVHARRNSSRDSGKTAR